MSIIINPGTGPVVDATKEDAYFNLGAFVADLIAGGLPVPDVERIESRDSGDGRFEFILHFGTHDVDVSMPGLPLSRVRYTGADGQNIFDFPRLYINGSSWLWGYALNMCEAPDGAS